MHRDVKPANILFRDDETPLLTDFGIAKQVNMDTDLTSTGMFVGSPNYTSPEQADGIEIDGRADIYSLGCIFHELLTGEKPYQSDTVIDILIQHKQAPIPILPGHLRDFQRLLNMMLAKDRDNRFENTAILNGYIENLISNRNTISEPALDAEAKDAEDPGGKRKRRSLTILTGLIILSAIVFGTLNYVEIRIKDDKIDLDNISIATSLAANPIIATNIMATPATDNTIDNQSTIQSASKKIIDALLWLGKQSLEEYRLTYPPKDNAYYYFSRLLELDPQSNSARLGLLNIADRYAILAEQALTNNEFEKIDAYTNIGLKINPSHEALLSLQEFNKEMSERSFLETLKGFFSK